MASTARSLDCPRTDQGFTAHLRATAVRSVRRPNHRVYTGYRLRYPARAADRKVPAPFASERQQLVQRTDGTALKPIRSAAMP